MIRKTKFSIKIFDSLFEKSEYRAGCQLTAGGGDSKESATEINRLYIIWVRVER